MKKRKVFRTPEEKLIAQVTVAVAAALSAALKEVLPKYRAVVEKQARRNGEGVESDQRWIAPNGKAFAMPETRALRIIKLRKRGFSDRDIADDVKVSETTVRRLIQATFDQPEKTNANATDSPARGKPGRSE